MHVSPPSSLGSDLRALRKARGLTLTDVATEIGRSVGWLSQVERDKSSPSVDELRRLTELYHVAMSTLFGETPARPGEEGKIVRAGARRFIGDRVAGLSEELISPDLTDDFEVVHSTFAAGAKLEKTITRPTQELAYVVSGELEVEIAGQCFTVGPGDSFRIRNEPYRWANNTQTPCVAIWVIAPPVY